MGNCLIKNGSKKQTKINRNGASLDFSKEVSGLIKHRSNL